MERSKQQRDDARLQRQQVGAAIALGFLLLVVIVVRAIHGNVLPAGWWRP